MWLNNKLKQKSQRLWQILLLWLALIMLTIPLKAIALNNLPLAPPDTSSPQKTLKSFIENVNKSYQIFMAAYEQAQK